MKWRNLLYNSIFLRSRCRRGWGTRQQNVVKELCMNCVRIEMCNCLGTHMHSCIPQSDCVRWCDQKRTQLLNAYRCRNKMLTHANFFHSNHDYFDKHTFVESTCRFIHLARTERATMKLSADKWLVVFLWICNIIHLLGKMTLRN